MALIELKDGTRAYVDDDMDFRLLVEKYMGYDAGYWYMRHLDESWHVEEDCDALDHIELFWGVDVRDKLEDYLYNDRDNDNKKVLGDWLKKRRESMHLSQKQLSETISISIDAKPTTVSNVISKIERGERNVPLKYRAAYAKALRIKVRDFDAECNRFRPHVKE